MITTEAGEDEVREMGVLWRFTLLDDAYFFLNRAKSMTDTPPAKKAKLRFIRSSVLFSWQALEEGTKHRLRSIASVPRKFSEKLELALSLQRRSGIFKRSEFSRVYKLRNDIVHANAGSPDPTLQDAEEMFRYSKKILGALYGEVLLTIDEI